MELFSNSLLSVFSNTANYSCQTSNDKEISKNFDSSDLTTTAPATKTSINDTNNNNNKNNFHHHLVSLAENFPNIDIVNDSSSPFLHQQQQIKLENPYNITTTSYSTSEEDLIQLYDSSSSVDENDIYFKSDEEETIASSVTAFSASGHTKLYDIICKESDPYTSMNSNDKGPQSMDTKVSSRKKLSANTVVSPGRTSNNLKPETKRVVRRAPLKSTAKDEVAAERKHLNNNNLSKLEKENDKEKINNEKTDSSSGTGKRYILRSARIMSSNSCSQPPSNNLLNKSAKPTVSRSSSANPSTRSRISSSSGTLAKSGTTKDSENKKQSQSQLNRPKSTPALLIATTSSMAVGATQKMTSSTESSSNSTKIQNPIRTTKASRLRAAAFDNQRIKEMPVTRSRTSSKQQTSAIDGLLQNSLPLPDELILQNKLNKTETNMSNKRLIPSIAVCVNQTLRDDDKTLVPFSVTEIENESSLTISPRKRTSTMCKNGENLNICDFGLSPVESCHSKSPSPRNERDKSAKRKSNLNRALNTESTNDDAAAAKRRTRRQLGMARTLLPEDESLSFIKGNLSSANMSSQQNSSSNSNNKLIDSSDLKAVTNFNNNHILTNINNNNSNFKTKDTVNINSKSIATSSSDENSKRKSSKSPSDLKLNLATKASITNAGETRKLSANTNNNKIASSLRSQTLPTVASSSATVSLPNVVKKISVIRCKSDLPKIEKISLKLSATGDGTTTKKPSTSSLQLSGDPTTASSGAFSLKTSSNKFEEKFNELMSECDKKLTSLTPIADSTQQSQSPQPTENTHNNNNETTGINSVISNVVNDEPNLILENVIRRNAPTPLRLHSKSLDDSRLESAQNHIVSILKKKDPNESSSSSNASPVTFSSSVLDTPTRTASRQGILKKRSSLDESRYSRSQSPDDRGILIKHQRRNSLEESQPGILKQRNSEPKIDNQNSTDLPPHGILKKKETPTSSESQSKHVSITEAAYRAAAELCGDVLLNGNSYDVKPILKSDSSTNPTNAPRPILKKKYSSETEEYVRPILKSSRKSSREENLSDTDDCIRSILKTDSPLKRLNYTTPFDANMVLQRSKSLETQEYNHQLEVGGLGARPIDGSPSSTVLSTLDKPVVTVSERIKNMEKLLGAVPKTTLIKRDKDRFKTQPVTSEEFNSVQKSCAAATGIFKPITSLDNLNLSNSTTHVDVVGDDETSVDLFKFLQSSQPLLQQSHYDSSSSLSATAAVVVPSANFCYSGEMSSSNTDSNNSDNPSDVYDQTTNMDDNDRDTSNKERKNTVNLVRKPSIKERAKFLEKIANSDDDKTMNKKPLANRSQLPPKINIKESLQSANESSDFDGDQLNKSLSTSSIGPSSLFSSEATTNSTSGNSEGGSNSGGILKLKTGCVGLFSSALNSELKNRLKKSTHASVANLKKSKSNILDSTTFSNNNNDNNTSYSNNSKNNNENNHNNNSSHDSSSDSDSIIVPSKNLAQALRNLSSSSSTTTTTMTASSSAFVGVDAGHHHPPQYVDRINNNNNNDDTKSLISNLQNFDKTIKNQIQQQQQLQQQQLSSTSEGESSGGREISEIIKNSAIARRKKYSDGFENWTTPEYYKTAEENFIKDQKHKLKLANLAKRRDKLRAQLETENRQYQTELEEQMRPKSKKYQTNTLQEIATNINRTKNEKLRSDMESKLYRKWRYGLSPDRENIILESKNENVAMAKLNWLDRQVEYQLQKEQCQKESDERQLKLEEEKRKHEEFITKSQYVRETEIKELRSIQENHIHELKSREDDCNRLKNTEALLNYHKVELENLHKTIEVNSVQRAENAAVHYNVRKIKMLFRQRSNDVQNNLHDDIVILKRMLDLNPSSDKIMSILKKFESQLGAEKERQSQIESMYESEVKYHLAKQQTVWSDEMAVREIILKNLMHDELDSVHRQYADCVDKQKYLFDLRKSHVQAVSDLNARLKDLMVAENDLNKLKIYTGDDEGVEQICDSVGGGGGGGGDGCGKNNLSGRRYGNRGDGDAPLEPPRFGRKKVAWI